MRAPAPPCSPLRGLASTAHQQSTIFMRNLLYALHRETPFLRRPLVARGVGRFCPIAAAKRRGVHCREGQPGPARVLRSRSGEVHTGASGCCENTNEPPESVSACSQCCTHTTASGVATQRRIWGRRQARAQAKSGKRGGRRGGHGATCFGLQTD